MTLLRNSGSEFLQLGVAIAIDGEDYQDALLRALHHDSEVVLFNGIARW